MGSALDRRLRPALNCFRFCLAAAQVAEVIQPAQQETAVLDRGGAAGAVVGQHQVLERQAMVALVAVL